MTNKRDANSWPRSPVNSISEGGKDRKVRREENKNGRTEHSHRTITDRADRTSYSANLRLIKWLVSILLETSREKLFSRGTHERV